MCIIYTVPNDTLLVCKSIRIHIQLILNKLILIFNKLILILNPKHFALATTLLLVSHGNFVGDASRYSAFLRSSRPLALLATESVLYVLFRYVCQGKHCLLSGCS